MSAVSAITSSVGKFSQAGSTCDVVALGACSVESPPEPPWPAPSRAKRESDGTVAACTP